VTCSPSSLTFTAGDWNVPQTVQVIGADDDLDDGNRAVVIAVAATSDDGQYQGRTSQVTATNQDDDDSRVVASPTSLITYEAAGSASCQIQLTCRPTAPVTVTWTIDDPLDRDEFLVWTGSFVVDPNDWNVPVTVTLTGADDAGSPDGNQPAMLAIVCASGDTAYQGATTGVAVTNIDDDTPGLLVVVPDAEASEAGDTATVRIRLTSLPTDTVTVTVAGNSQLGLAGTTLTFLAQPGAGGWDTLQDVTVPAFNDAVAEGTHTGQVTLTANSTDGDYNNLSAPMTIAITDDDAPGITVTPTSGLETTEVGGEDTFDVVLTSQPTHDVRISLNSSVPSQGIITGGVIELTFTPGNWNQAQTVTVRGQDANQLDDGNVPYQIRLQPAISTDPNYAGRDADDVAVVNRSVNNPPTMQDPPTNIPFTEDEAEKTVNLMGIGIGQSNEGQTPSVTIDDTAVAAFLDVVLAYTAPASEGVLAMTPKADQHGTGDILITVSDGIDSVVKTVTVTVSARNDSPVLTVDGQDTLALSGTLAIRGGAGNPASQLRIIASDIETAIGDLDCRIPLRPNLGALKLGPNPLTGTTLQNGSTFKYQEILDGNLHYVHNGVLSGEDGFAIEIADGGQLDTNTSVTDPSRSEVAIITLTITGLTPPQVTINNASPATWTEGDAAVRIDAAVTVQDFDSTDFDGGLLTVSAATAKVGERIAIDGTLLAGITVSGTQLQTNPGGVLVGTMSGGTDLTPLSISLTAACTPALAQTILSGLTWTNISDHPGAQPDDGETRTLTITLTDGDGSTPVPATRSITVDPVDDAPVIAAYTVVLTPGLTVSGQLIASDPEGSAVTFATTTPGVTLPGRGNLTIDTAGAFTYEHNNLLYFTDSFGVTVSAGGQTATRTIDIVISDVDPLAPAITSLAPMRISAGGSFQYTPTFPPGVNTAAYQYQLVPQPEAGTWTFDASSGRLNWPSIPAPGDGSGYHRFGILVIDRTSSPARASYQPVTLKVSVGGNG
jgi:hypothetical protein